MHQHLDYGFEAFPFGCLCGNDAAKVESRWCLSSDWLHDSKARGQESFLNRDGFTPSSPRSLIHIQCLRHQSYSTRFHDTHCHYYIFRYDCRSPLLPEPPRYLLFSDTTSMTLPHSHSQRCLFSQPRQLLLSTNFPGQLYIKSTDRRAFHSPNPYT